jgi:hypothetical protein
VTAYRAVSGITQGTFILADDRGVFHGHYARDRRSPRRQPRDRSLASSLRTMVVTIRGRARLSQ